jgi:tRNA (mo5U34)-methyltransferase
MSRLNLKMKRVSVSADVPDTVARQLHHLRNRVRRAAPGVATGAPTGGLTIADRLPELSVQERNPLEAVEFFRTTRGPTDVAPNVNGNLAAAVEKLFWYHTIELPGGLVTPGLYDHRPLVPHYGLPEHLDGQRVLDVAPFDGFWAFELERRGAEVVAADINRFSACDFPPPVRQALLDQDLDRETGLGFRLAQQALGSKVSRIERSIYDLDPADIGLFDLVHVADLLLHLERPLAALRALRSVTRGKALIVDCFDPNLDPGTVRYMGAWTGVPWWLPSLETLGQMVIDAGFASVELRLVYALAPKGEERGHWRASLVATV